MMTTETSTPIGTMRIAVHEGRLCALTFTDRWGKKMQGLDRRFTTRTTEDTTDVVRRLRDYFAGDLDAFEGLEVTTGGTDFQRQVWRVMRRIPAGRTMSYGELARRIGLPDAARAVGAASGSNPIGLVIPCHRVVGSDGRLTGYGGGLDRKRWLLRHEGVAA